MASFVRVSTIGAAPLRFAPEGAVYGQEAVDAMIAHWQTKLGQVLPDRPDLIVVPEACDRFPEHSMEDRLDYYRVRKDQVRTFFAGVAEKNGCYIAYSAARELEDGTWRNSTQIIDRSGNVSGIYNKNHVVIEETTQAGILCGKDAPVFQCDFGTVACAICFDLNFDELRLKYVQARPDLILFSSMYHGGLMQAYWAYSCRAHFVGAIAGDQSAIISPVGECIASTTNYFDFTTATVNLDCRVVHLDHHWDKLGAMRDKYGSKVRVSDPGHLGCVLISAEAEDLTVKGLLDEFEIATWDEYMARSLAHHHDPANVEA
ncbi:MAG: carbon-nitrogen hydrolase family protein [Candidatus Hydrogenedentes bacterium]|nr:carbon-nitrogen hydrolase family protein [Candidatus Hydrogenedentota bacterium]